MSQGVMRLMVLVVFAMQAAGVGAFDLSPKGTRFDRDAVKAWAPSWLDPILTSLAEKGLRKFKSPVHEEITHRIYDCNYEGASICGNPDGEFASPYVLAGVRWNDDPPFQMNPNQAQSTVCKTRYEDGRPMTIRFITQPKCWAQLFLAAEKQIKAGTSSGPTLSGISPSSGRLGGNDFITLTGTGFVSGAVVTIGGNVATSCTVQSTTSITCYSPAGTLGAKDVVLSQSTGTQSLAGAFTYVPGPTLTGVSPTSGPTSGGTSVTMTGTNFLSGTIVRFGGFDATGCSLSGTTSISCATPSMLNPGAVNVDIVTNGGVATLTSAYTYTAAAPTLTSVSPTSGAAAGGELIILNGTNFINGATVTVGGVAQYGCAMGAPAGAQMYCTTAPNTPGVKTVVVTTSGGSATLTNAYTVIGASCPSGTTVNWSQSQSAWYGNTNTQGTYACSGSLPATIADGGSTSVSNTTSGRSGSVTASCSNGTVSLSGQSCDGGTLAAGEDCNWSPWGTYGIDVNYAYITYLKRCPVTSDYSYWTGIAETYGQATMTNAIATSPEASCAASAGHICSTAESNYCGATAGYPWNSPGQNLCKRLP